MKKAISISPNPIMFIDESNTRCLGLEVTYDDNSTKHFKLLDVEELKKIYKEVSDRVLNNLNLGTGEITQLK